MIRPLAPTGVDSVGRGRSIFLLSGLLLLSGIIQALNLKGSPWPLTDEGLLTSQVWARLHPDQLLPGIVNGTASLGVAQLALWVGATDAFDRHATAIAAVREAVLVAHLVAVAMLWLLTRRLRLHWIVGGAAVAIYALSPLAIMYHRAISIENLAVAWFLTGWVLALVRVLRPLAAVGAVIAIAMAVATEPLIAVLLPYLAWTVLQPAGLRTPLRRRRTTLIVLAGVAVVSVVVPLVFARPASGGGAPQVFVQWLSLDPVTLPLAALGAVIALTNRTLRPLGAGLIGSTLVLLALGQFDAMSVVLLLPLAVVVVTGSARVALRSARRVEGQRWGTGAIAVAAALTVAAVVAVPVWGAGQSRLFSNQNASLQDATGWLSANVSPQARMLVDEAMRTDLIRAGYRDLDVVPYQDADTDPTALAGSPDGWSNYTHVVSTAEMRSYSSGFPVVRDALENSQVVASFGTDVQQVQVHRVLPQGLESAERQQRAELADRREVGVEVVKNRSLQMTPQVRDLIRSGNLDPRALILLTRAGTLGELSISALPQVRGESDALPRRQVLITGRDNAFLSDADITRLSNTFTEQDQRFKAMSVTPLSGSLLVTWSLDYPAGLLK